MFSTMSIIVPTIFSLALQPQVMLFIHKIWCWPCLHPINSPENLVTVAATRLRYLLRRRQHMYIPAIPPSLGTFPTHQRIRHKLQTSNEKLILFHILMQLDETQVLLVY